MGSSHCRMAVRNHWKGPGARRGAGLVRVLLDRGAVCGRKMDNLTTAARSGTLVGQPTYGVRKGEFVNELSVIGEGYAGMVGMSAVTRGKPSIVGREESA